MFENTKAFYYEWLTEIIQKGVQISSLLLLLFF